MPNLVMGTIHYQQATMSSPQSPLFSLPRQNLPSRFSHYAAPLAAIAAPASPQGTVPSLEHCSANGVVAVADVEGDTPEAEVARRNPAVPEHRESSVLPTVSAVVPFFLWRFTYKEIKRATDGFSRIIGSDSGGAAYKAQFPDGLVGVVKKVRVLAPESDAFHRDLQFLACLHHRHLVGLRGFSEEHDRFLVFDYMENGSLREIIHDPLRTPLTWRARLQIATDVAASLEYLCLFCDPPPCNLTVSAENILLDGNSVAKLSTFGSMSFDGQVREPSDEEDLKGVSGRGDDQILFQFGALILELVTGQSFGSQGADLLRWIQRADFSHSMNQMVDSDLGNAYDSSELKSLLFIARLCIKTGGRGPPSFSISHVLRFLQRKVNGADSREM